MNELGLDDLRRIFPAYLSGETKVQLAEHLKQYPANKNYFASSQWEGPADPIQGDVWSSFLLLNFDDGSRHEVSGIVLSNSCDIDRNNPSMRARNVLFAPIIPLNLYAERLEKSDKKDKVASHIEAVRGQIKSEVFYLPASTNAPECVVQFDAVHAQPLEHFVGTKSRKLVARFNSYGFYVFLMKLSIHFTRFGEALDRPIAV